MTLILPPGVEPTPEPLPFEVPQEIQDSVDLLREAIEGKGQVVIMARKLDDGVATTVYDLGIALQHPITNDVITFRIARLFPQTRKHERPETPVPASAAND